MDLTILKRNNSVEIYLGDKKVKTNKNYCFIVGSIFNLKDLYSGNLTKKEDIVIKLYLREKEDLFKKLNGEYAIFMVIEGNIILVRDRMGSKQVFYTEIDGTFICSTSLRYLIHNYKAMLTIDKQEVANYLCYTYIQEPKTIFKEVFKLNTGCYLRYIKNIEVIQYYDLIREYFKNRNKIRGSQKSKDAIEGSLIESIRLRTKDAKRVGVFLSAGIDSSLITSLLKNLSDKKINTYTVGFYEEERNEAKEAKKIANYLGSNHHEFYLDHETARRITKEAAKTYSEPFADQSLIPILFLNEKIDKRMDIVLTGDGADQLFCGSTSYDKPYIVDHFKAMLSDKTVQIRCFLNRQKYTPRRNPYIHRLKEVKAFLGIEPIVNCNFWRFMFNEQIRYMLYDLQAFLPNRLFTKVSFPAYYSGINIAHPFIDNQFVTSTLKVEHKQKYYKKNKKKILKDILYDYIPSDFFESKKKGFGVPIKEWLYNIYKDDILKFSDLDTLAKQDIFPAENVSVYISKFMKGDLSQEERIVLFSYYMFQLWYQEYIEDLWQK